MLGDRNGIRVHLGERDCSVQRRHQKLLEESPGLGASRRRRAPGSTRPRSRSPTPSTTCPRARWSSSSTATGSFYFIEMNTRIQVEHPVTEMVTGIDLVREQIRIAAGEPLGYKQDAVQFTRTRHRVPHQRRGSRALHALARARHRLGASRRARGARGQPPDGRRTWCRRTTTRSSPRSSSHGRDRAEAIARMHRALSETVVEGIKTTIPYPPEAPRRPGVSRRRLHAAPARAAPLRRRRRMPLPSPLYVILDRRSPGAAICPTLLDARARGRLPPRPAPGQAHAARRALPARAGASATAAGRSARSSSSTTGPTSPSRWAPTACTSARTTCPRAAARRILPAGHDPGRVDPRSGSGAPRARGRRRLRRRGQHLPDRDQGRASSSSAPSSSGALRREIPVPLVGIGGITADNAAAGSRGRRRRGGGDLRGLRCRRPGGGDAEADGSPGSHRRPIAPAPAPGALTASRNSL